MKPSCLRLCSIFVTLVSTITAVGQLSDVEKSFDLRKSSYTLERFHEVDDPSSPDSKYVVRFDYLYYKDADQIVKIRVIESAGMEGETPSIKVDDYFFLSGQLRLVRLYFFIPGRIRLQAIKSGSIVPLLTGEHIELENGKLTKWVALGKNRPPTHPLWADKQTSVALDARIQIHRYESFKNPK